MTSPIQESIARNTSYKCRANTCNLPRRNLSAYCKNHYQKFYLYGDPNGKALKQSEYKKEYDEVSELITKHLTHIATDTALKFIQAWLDNASSGKPCVMAYEMARLCKGGVSALTILKEATAIYLYSQRKPNSLPDDERLNYQVGIALLRLTEQYTFTDKHGNKAHRKASGTERKAIGRHLRQSLGLFLFNVVAAINKREQEDYTFRESLWTPLG